MPFYDLYIFIGWVLLLVVRRWLQLPSMMTAKIGLVIFLTMFSVRAVGKMRTEQLAVDYVPDRAERIETRPTYYQPWILYIRSSQSIPRWTPINVLSGQTVADDQIIERWFPRIPIRRYLRRNRG